MTDPYVEAAAKLYKCEPEEVTPAQRKDAKDILFGTLYGTENPLEKVVDFREVIDLPNPEIDRIFEKVIERAIDEGHIDDRPY